MRWRRNHPTTPAAPTVADECEAFLTGHSAERAVQWGRAVPTWAWINLLAHARAQDLAGLAGGAPLPGTGPDHGRWWVVVRRLAGAVLDQAKRSDTPIAVIQAGPLSAVESWLVDDEPMSQISPDQLIAVVLAVLHGHPAAA